MPFAPGLNKYRMRALRCFWWDDHKLRIIAQSDTPGVSVSLVACH